MHALVYCRVSGEKQEENYSLETQESACRQFAAANGYTSVRVVREVYSGASLWERKLLLAERDRIKAGEYQAVIAYAVDRLSRDIAHLFILAEEIERVGARLLFVTEDLDDSAEGRLLRSVRSYVAQVEREKIRERTMRGRRARLESGKLLRASMPLYGYYQDADGRRTINDNEAAIVRRIFALALSGLGALSIARRLNADDIPLPSVGKRNTSRLSAWGKSTIMRILREPAYAGLSYGMRWQHIRKNGTAKVIERPRNEWIILESNLTPPIISQSDFDATQTALAGRRGDTRRNERHPVLLRGLITCLKCGRRRSPDVSGYGYRCTSRCDGAGRCGSASTPMQAVEAWVWSELQKSGSDPAQIEAQIRAALESRLADKESIRQSLAQLQAKTVRAENNLRQLLARFGDDPDLARFVEEQIRKQSEQIKLLAVERDSLQAQLAATDAEQVQLDEMAAVAARLAIETEPDFAAKRELLELFKVSVATDGNEDWRLHIGATLGGQGGHNVFVLWMQCLPNVADTK